MEVEIISRETIKPSSPTPPHLKTYAVSLLDQLIPPSYAALIFHYSSSSSSSPKTTSRRLKLSLSQALTRFYPFAGKLRPDLSSVDCDDEGAFYVEARAELPLAGFLSRHGADSDSLRQLIPVEPIWAEPRPLLLPSGHGGCFVAVVQVTFFGCGGVAVGVSVLHRVADGACLISFAKSWAATCRGRVVSLSTGAIRPSFAASGLFPQNGSLTKALAGAPRSKLMRSGGSALRKFAFDEPAIANIRARASAATDGTLAPTAVTPTRVEAVSALLWKCATAAAAASKAERGEPVNAAANAVLSEVVNVRRRAAPPFPENSFGNFIWTATARCPISSSASASLPALVSLIREAKQRIDGEFVKKLQGEEGFAKVCECIRESSEVFAEDGAEFLSVTSLCGSGKYEVDFGWGKPTWVRMGISVKEEYMNLVFLMDMREGKGVEAWVLLGEEEMAIFQRHPEILQLAPMETPPGFTSLGHSRL